MPASIRLILADDHPIVRHGLRQIIEADDTLAIVAEVGDGKAALAAIQTHAPDVAVLDIDMPVLDGFAVVRALSTLQTRPEVVFLTMHSERELFEAALELGIKGYVLKESAVTDIVAAIKAVAAGQPYLSPALSAHVVNRRSGQEDFRRNSSWLDHADAHGAARTGAHRGGPEYQGDRGAALRESAHRGNPPPEHRRQAQRARQLGAGALRPPTPLGSLTCCHVSDLGVKKRSFDAPLPPGKRASHQRRVSETGVDAPCHLSDKPRSRDRLLRPHSSPSLCQREQTKAACLAWHRTGGL